MTSLSCRSGGSATGVIPTESAESSTPPIVNIPTIAFPLTSPYYSQSDFLDISGLCMVGYTVGLSGSFNAQEICENSMFTFRVNKNTDGVYAFLITQSSPNNVISNPVSILWVRKTSVSSPGIKSPAINPYFSAEGVLTISGACETGATISLSGDGAGSTTCQASQFSLSLPKASDGDFNLSIIQVDQAGNSSTLPFVWKKHSLTVLPSHPTLTVNTPQVLTLSGGTESFSVSISTNSSGGNYNSSTKTYTPGIVAGGIDVLTVTDSIGETTQIQITVVPGDPDHLEMGSPSGDNQTGNLGQLLPTALKAKIVDKYGNGIFNYPLYFQKLLGDAEIVDNPIQFSDSAGAVSVNVRMGSGALSNQIKVGPLSGVLMDVNATGNTSLLFNELTLSSSAGYIGALYGISQNPQGMVVADFNGDGIQDMAALNSGDPSIGILLGSGKGNFKKMTKILSLCSSPNGISNGDFNSDSKVDLVVTCGSSAFYSLQIILGNGDGTFQVPANIAIDANENIPYGIVVSDFSGDSKLDIATTSAGSGKVFVRKGNGNGTFQAPVSYDVASSPGALTYVDVNNDGKLDLVVVNSGDNTVSVLKNNGSGTFSTFGLYGTGVAPTAVAAADFDGDGFADLAIVNNSDSSVSIFINDQTGHYNAGTDLSVGTNPNSIIAKDLNGDSKIDLVISNGSDNSVSVFSGAGNGVFTNIANVATLTNPNQVTAFDINTDGSQDLLILGFSSQQIQVLPGRSNFSFGYLSTVGANPVAMVIVDLNKDQIQDVAVVNSNSKTVSLLQGLGNGLFNLTSTLNTGDNSNAIASGDLRKNKTKDLIVTCPNLGHVKVYLGNGDGSFAAPVNYTTGAGPSSVITIDFNNDGLLDIATANLSSNTVSVLLGNGDGTFLTKVENPVGNGATSLVAADLNGDRKLDIVVANLYNNSISVLLNNGDGTFQTQVEYSSGMGTISLLAADFNNDGKADIAATNSAEGTVSIFIGVGNGALNSPNVFSAGLDPNGLIAADFKGNEKLSLAVANGYNNTFTVLWGTGSGQFTTSTTYSSQGSLSAIGVGELNGDNVSDVLVLDSISNKLEVWIGH